MSADTTAIEHVAKALHAEACRVMRTEEPAWDYLPEELREMYRGQARAAITAIEGLTEGPLGHRP